jgi:ribonuclease D
MIIKFRLTFLKTLDWAFEDRCRQAMLNHELIILRTWRDQTAKRFGLDSALLLNRSLIKAIAVENPDTIDELTKVEGIHNWQVDAFGEEILKALK